MHAREREGGVGGGGGAVRVYRARDATADRPLQSHEVIIITPGKNEGTVRFRLSACRSFFHQLVPAKESSVLWPIRSFPTAQQLSSHVTSL